MSTSIEFATEKGRRYCRALLIAVAAMSASAYAQPQPNAYPAHGRYVTVIVPFSLGTGPDVLARLAGIKLSERWGISFVVDNRPGASGNIGSEMVLKSAPDGYTLMMTATTFALNPALSKSARYDPVKSFAPVVLVATGTLAYASSMNTPAKDLREFIALAKARPGELNYASSGNGTPQHLTMELFKMAAGINVTHVPYKDTANATRDLAGGFVNAMIFPINSVVPLVQAEKVRVLAVFDKERSAVFPNAPTVTELGFNVESSPWFALFAPLATPREVVQKLNREINSILALADVKDVLAKQGLVAAGGTPERLAEVVKVDHERWKEAIVAAKIKGD
jgi:tripartite-type tricarboxylate transporter receptor subunit TctC